MPTVCSSACCASVRTARSTDSRASAVFGLNSFCSSAAIRRARRPVAASRVSARDWTGSFIAGLRLGRVAALRGPCGLRTSVFSRSGSLIARSISCSAPCLPSMYDSRFDSSVRASSSRRSASTLRAIAAGEKSSICSNVMSTLSIPSPVSVFGTWNATRGATDFIRSSKLSTSISRNLRSGKSGNGSARLPARSEITPITNGNCTLRSAP